MRDKEIRGIKELPKDPMDHNSNTVMTVPCVCVGGGGEGGTEVLHGRVLCKGAIIIT